MSTYTLYVDKGDRSLHYYLTNSGFMCTRRVKTLSQRSISESIEILQDGSFCISKDTINMNSLVKIADFTTWDDLITNYPELLL
jgi:hypothetical protein